jgi:hypothetical protein
MTDSSTFISNLSQAARDNPLAAALIGGGALWLLLGNRAIGNAFGNAASVAQPLAESGMRGVSNAAGTVTGASGRAAETATDAARAMMRTAGNAATEGAGVVRDRVADTYDRATDTLHSGANALRSADPLPRIQRGYAGAQSALTGLLERQPLAIGAIGLAIGAGVANAIASTNLEKEWAGPLSDEVKDAVKGRAERVATTAQRAAGDATSEFRAAANEAADPEPKAGQDTVQSVRDKADAARR